MNMNKVINPITWVNRNVEQQKNTRIAFTYNSKVGKIYIILFGDAHTNCKIMKKSKEMIDDEGQDGGPSRSKGLGCDQEDTGSEGR